MKSKFSPGSVVSEQLRKTRKPMPLEGARYFYESAVLADKTQRHEVVQRVVESRGSAFSQTIKKIAEQSLTQEIPEMEFRKVIDAYCEYRLARFFYDVRAKRQTKLRLVELDGAEHIELIELPVVPCREKVYHDTTFSDEKDDQFQLAKRIETLWKKQEKGRKELAKLLHELHKKNRFAIRRMAKDFGGTAAWKYRDAKNLIDLHQCQLRLDEMGVGGVCPEDQIAASSLLRLIEGHPHATEKFLKSCDGNQTLTRQNVQELAGSLCAEKRPSLEKLIEGFERQLKRHYPELDLIDAISQVR